MAPSPAAGKATGGAPRTPTKLGRKPQSSQTPKLGQAASSTSAGNAKKPAAPKAPEVEKPAAETPEVPEKPEAGDIAQKGSEAAQGAQDKAGEAAKDTTEKAEGAPAQASKVEMKDNSDAGSTAADDDDDEDDDEGPLSKVSQAGDQAKGALEEQDPQPIDDSNDDAVTGAQEAADDAADDVEDDTEDVEDNATEKAGDTADDADDATDDAQETAGKVAGDTQDTAEQTGGNLLKGAKGLAGKASGLAGKAAQDPAKAAKDAPSDVKETVEDVAGDAKDTAEDSVEGVKESAEDVADDAKDTAEDAKDTAEDVADDAKDTAEDAKDSAEDAAEDAKDTAGDVAADAKDTAEDAADDAQSTAGDVADKAKDTAEDATDDAEKTAGDVTDKAKDATDDAAEGADDAADAEDGTGDAPDLSELPLDLSVLKGLEVNEDGTVYDSEGKAVGKLAEGDAEDLAGYPIGDDGEILDDDGDLVGRVELMPDEVRKQLTDLKEKDELPEGAEDYLNQIPDADVSDDGEDDGRPQLPGLSFLKGLTCDPTGLIFNDDGDTVGQVVDGDPQELMNATLNEHGEFIDEDGNVVGHAQVHEDAAQFADQAQDAADDAQGAAGDAKDAVDDAQDAAEDAQDAAEDAGETAQAIEDELPGIEALQGKELNEAGEIVDDQGNVLGNIEDQELKDKIESGDLKAEDLEINEAGEVVDEEGNVLGKVGLAEGAAEKLAGAMSVDLRILNGRKVNKKGKVLDDEGEEIGELTKGEVKDCAGKTVNDKGQVLDKDGNVIGKVAIVPGEAAETATRELLEELGELPEQADEEEDADAEEESEEPAGPQFKIPDLDVLEGLKVNKKGKLLNEDGEEIGELTSGDLAECTGKKVNEKGEVLDSEGNVIGRVKALPQEIPTEELEQAQDAQEAAEDAAENAEAAAGDVEDAQDGAEDAQEGAEDAQEGAEDAQEGAEDAQEAAEDAAPELPPLSVLEGLKVNKAGKLVNDEGVVVGELTEGDAKKLSKSGITADSEGQFWDDKGHVIGRAKTVPVEDSDEEAPFAGLEGLIVVKDGYVDDENGNRVGVVTEGDAKKLLGRAVDEDGDIIDKKGSVVGHAERWEEPEAEEAVEEETGPELPPLSILEGLKVNKAGKLVDANGTIVGELVEGDAKKLSKSGITSDDKGQFWDNKGNVIGRAETVPAPEEAEEESPFAGLEGLIVVKDGYVEEENGNRVGVVTEGDAKKLIGRAVDEDGDIIDKKGNVVGHAERWVEPEEEAEPEAEPADLSILAGKTVNKMGMVIGDEGVPIARLVEGNSKELAGKKVDGEGQIWNDQGKVIGRVELIPENEREAKPEGPFAGLEDLRVVPDGKVADGDDNIVGEIVEGNPKRLIGLSVDEDGDIIDKYGNVKGHAEPIPDEEEVVADNSILDGKQLNKQGFVVNEEGIPIGKLIEGNVKELAGRRCDEEGLIHSDTGKVVGRCEVLPENERVAKPEGPFAGLEGLHVNKDGKVEDGVGNVVGLITEGNAKRLIGLAVDEDGDINDKFGNVKGHAEPIPDEEETVVDNSLLEGKKLNKQGFVVNEEGIPIGKLVEGNVKELAGRRCDEEGNIHGDTGKIVGRCEVLPENERVVKPEGPFAGLEGLHVNKQGMVEDAEGNVVGIITEGNAKRLTGLAVDEDGDINDKFGNVKGHAEPYEEEEQTPEDLAALAGCTVNKAGNVVDSSGTVLGRVSEGDPKSMIGKKVDGQGQIWDNAGNVIGKAELVKGQDSSVEGPFAGFENITVDKEGMVVTPDGSIVGRVIEGDVKKLVAHKVDEDGDIQDKNGNSIGKAERWEPEEKERKINPMSGRRVNKEGEVRDENGDIMGRLTAGDLQHCVGLEIDDNGYVIDNDGNKVGEVTLLANIAEEELEEIPEEELTPEQQEELRQKEQDRQIAEKMGNICAQTLERVQPVCKQITDLVEKADRTPREELDEEELVNNVKPLIEEGGRILQECNGSLRGLDPDGRIAAQAKGRAGTKEATPEEYRLADTLKELTGTVVTTIDNAKKRISDMPHAKKKLNPLWGLMTQPLFQILAAVGLLLTGVLGLVGQLLNGLGLGGLVNGLLGGLGIDKLLGGLGLGSVANSLGLGKKDKKSSGGGASSLPLVGGLFGKK